MEAISSSKTYLTTLETLPNTQKRKTNQSTSATNNQNRNNPETSQDQITRTLLTSKRKNNSSLEEIKISKTTKKDDPNDFKSQ